MNTLRLAKHCFSLRFIADTELPPFVGNTIRGALGNALDKMNSDAYAQAFKTKASESVSNPYAISVPYPSAEKFHRGDTLTFFVTIFGNACEYGSNFAEAAHTMCQGKLQSCVLDSCALEYDRIWSDEESESTQPCDCMSVRFLTPTEILSSKRSVAEISFDTFIDSLFGRICGIIDNYTNGTFCVPYSLITKKPQITAEYNTHPVKLQTNGQPIFGVLGTIRYDGNVTRYLPYIELGSQLHIGKKTTRGCGAYHFEIGESFPLSQ